MAVTGQTGAGFIASADTGTYFTPLVYSTFAVTGGSPTGGNYLDVSSNRAAGLALNDTTRTFLWFHQRFYGISASTCPQWYFFAPNLIGHCTLMVNASGKFALGVHTQGTTWNYGIAYGWSPLAESTVSIKQAMWYSLEGEITIHDTTGAFKLWLNGEQIFDLSNIDTSNTTHAGNSYIYGMGVCGARVADWVVGDNTSPNAGHPGDLRVDCSMPNANGTDRANGGSGEMTRSTGSDDYTLVDEVASSAGTGDYWYADAVGEKCSVNVAALTNTGGTIVAVQCTVYTTKNDAGPCGFKIYCLRGGTRYYSDEFFPSFGSWLYFKKVWDQDPSTSAAWTESNFNAAEFGVERTT